MKACFWADGVSHGHRAVSEPLGLCARAGCWELTETEAQNWGGPVLCLLVPAPLRGRVCVSFPSLGFPGSVSQGSMPKVSVHCGGRGGLLATDALCAHWHLGFSELTKTLR